MQKKQGYLITAYKDFAAVYELALLLSQEDKVFIHVDAKSREIGSRELERLNEIPGCTAVSKYAIVWGGYTHVQAFLHLMEMALAAKDVSYLHFLTGEDFPLKSPAQIHDRFIEEKHLYLSYIEEKDFNEAVKKRYRYYNLFQNRNVKNPFLWQLQNLTAGLQKMCGVRREGLGEFTDIYKGLVYISMPKEAAADILSYIKTHPEYEKDLYHCQIPEEFFFHTLLLNKRFCNGKWKRLAVDRELRYMDWKRGDGGSPVYLSDRDYEAIAGGDYYFARKFHGKESQQLKKRIMQQLW